MTAVASEQITAISTVATRNLNLPYSSASAVTVTVKAFMTGPDRQLPQRNHGILPTTTWQKNTEATTKQKANK
jgi:hypothetical protein